jgi:hypothetical protein
VSGVLATKPAIAASRPVSAVETEVGLSRAVLGFSSASLPAICLGSSTASLPAVCPSTGGGNGLLGASRAEHGSGSVSLPAVCPPPGGSIGPLGASRAGLGSDSASQPAACPSPGRGVSPLGAFRAGLGFSSATFLAIRPLPGGSAGPLGASGARPGSASLRPLARAWSSRLHAQMPNACSSIGAPARCPRIPYTAPLDVTAASPVPVARIVELSNNNGQSVLSSGPTLPGRSTVGRADFTMSSKGPGCCTTSCPLSDDAL